MRSKPPFFIAFLYVSLLLTSQCTTKKTDQPPLAEGFDPPIPQTRSYAVGSITFPLKQLAEKINRELDPVLIGRDKDGKTEGIMSFRVERMGPVTVRYVNQQVRLSAPLQLWLTKPFNHDTTPPKQPFCALHVNFSTPISVTPNWRLNSKTKFIDYQWIVKPKLRILGIGFSLTDLVDKAIQRHKTDIENAIDSAVHEDLRLDKFVSPIWRDLQKPLLISRDYGLWLVPQPISVAAGQVTGNSEALTTHLRIAFDTRTEVKPTTPAYNQIPLPRLLKRDSIPPTSELHLMSYIPYTDINRIMALTIKKQPKQIMNGALTVKDVSVYGSRHALIAKVRTTGLYDGTVYLRGRPQFDTLTNTLRVSNLDFDTESGNIPTDSDNSPWHNWLRDRVSNWLTIPLGGEIAKFPEKIDKAYEQGPGKKNNLYLKSFRFVPQKIAIRPDGIQALINVESKVNIHIDKL